MPTIEYYVQTLDIGIYIDIDILGTGIFRFCSPVKGIFLIIDCTSLNHSSLYNFLLCN